MPDISIAATLISAFLAGGLGAIWYGPLCGNAWLKTIGKTKDEIDGGGKAIAIAMLTWLVSAAVYSALVISLGLGDFASLVQFSFLAWLGFGLVPTILSVIFQEKNPALLWIDGGYHLCAWLLMAIAHTLVPLAL